MLVPLDIGRSADFVTDQGDTLMLRSTLEGNDVLRAQPTIAWLLSIVAQAMVFV